MKRTTTILVIIFGLAFAGCGSSNSVEAEPATEPQEEIALTRAQVIETGDQLCTKFRKSTQKDEDAYDVAQEEGDYEDLADAVDGIRVGIEELSDEFEAINASPEDQPVLDEINEARRDIAFAEKKLSDALRAQDHSAIDTYVEDMQRNPVDGLMRGFGFKVCGSDYD